MYAYSLYTPDIWGRFLKKHGETKEQFLLKTYPQLDPFFDFFHRKDEVHDMVSDATLSKVAKHPFLPFVKILTKTPRYKYDNEFDAHFLETKIRPISFASHFDTYLYGFYAFALTEMYQKYLLDNGFGGCVLAYRTDLGGKCNIQFTKEAFDAVREKIRSDGSCTAIALDISGYFDNIDHFILKDKWSKILRLEELPNDQYKVFQSLTKYSYVNKDSILRHFDVNLKQHKGKWQTLLDLIPNDIGGKTFRDKLSLLRKRKLIVRNLPKKEEDGTLSQKGIPQGSAMSAILSNIYLIDFDKLLFDLSVEKRFTYRRYCDDILIVCCNHDVEYLSTMIMEEIKNYKLKIQSKKTEIIEFSQNSKGIIRGFDKKKIQNEKISITADNEQKYYKNLQYLGFEFNGQNVYIRPGSLSRYFRKMKGRIVKTIMMAYSDKSKHNKIFRKQLYERYSHLGKRNFLTYARNASKTEYINSKREVKEGMNSLSIKRQIASHFAILEKEVFKTSEQRAAQKKRAGKLKLVKH